MQLIPNFKTDFMKLWSVRCAILTGFFATTELVLPLLQTDIPHYLFAGLPFAAAMGTIVARAIQQGNVSGNA